MQPFLYYHPKFAIPSFAFMLMMASLVATGLAYWQAPKKKLSQIIILDLGILGTIMAIVGGRLFHVFVEAWGYYKDNPSHIYQIWRGGFVSYGAFIGLGLAWVVYLHFRKVSKLDYLDHIAVYSCPFVVLFVRIGCLLAGCCYGTPHEGFFSIVFHSGDAAIKYKGIPLHPTQIYAIIYSILIFLILYGLQKRQSFKGQLITSFLILYAIFRFLLEFLRGDLERGVYLDELISTAQIMSLISVSAGLAAYFYLQKRYPLAHKKTPSR